MQSSVLATIDDPSLRAYVCWVPILPEDSEAAARASAGLVTDGRAANFWDAHKTLPGPFAAMLGLPEGSPAWDVYLAYRAGARWGAGPPEPAFWQHQLGDEPNAPKLDGAVFAEMLRALLADCR